MAKRIEDIQLQLYEKLYFESIETKEKISSRSQMSLNILIVLSGVYAFLIKSILDTAFLEQRFPYVIYVMLGTLTLLLLLAASYYFIKVNHNHAHKKFNANETHELFERYQNFYSSEPECRAENEWVKEVRESFAKFSSFNDAQNAKRANWLFMSNRCLILSFYALILLGVSYLYLDAHSSTGPNVQKIQIVLPSNVIISEENTFMSDNNGSSDSKGKQESPPQVIGAPNDAERPTMQGELVIESDQTKQK